MIRMTPHAKERRRSPGVESLEGRALLSGLGLERPHGGGAAILARLAAPKFSFNQAGESAVIRALLGGAGHEFTSLALKEVRNPLGVAAGYENGTITQYIVKGIVLKQINWASSYTGFPHDTLALNIGGGVVLKKKQIELGAIVRGLFTTYPGTTYIVFGINRGAGGRLGPYYPSRPGITPDALVTVEVGPYGQNNSATITDLTTGTTQPINSPRISVAGPTVRILLNASQLPSEGFKLNQYTFAVWTETQPNAPIQDVGSFAPEDSMVPIGVETNVAPTL
jgi:hypothetical protein